MEYGCWLELAYELFRFKKWNGQNGNSGTKQEWLTVNFGISPRYSQMLRKVAKLPKNYSTFQNVGISFSEIYRRREQIRKLLQTNSIAACYWQGVDPINGYNTERTRSSFVYMSGAYLYLATDELLVPSFLGVELIFTWQRANL